MASYNKIEDIVASVDNAEQLITNAQYDDSTYTATGVDWFSYNGIVCSSIYANGNGWIGLGSSSEDLKVNRRDQAMWNLWREEGTFSGRRFLRIRWGGYSYYSYTSADYRITFDVLLFDTGDIMLYMVDIPTSYYTGTFYLGSLSYNAPSVDNRYVTFYLQEDGSYNIEYSPIDYGLIKYLIRDNSTLYTVVNGALSELTGELNSGLFMTNGFDHVPSGELLVPLNAPEVLCWTDGTEALKLTATVQGVAQGSHDIISDNIRVGHSSIYGITSVETTASDGATFLLSFDGGEWMSYNNGSWNVSNVGMTATELVAVPTEAWSSMINSATYMQLKATLDGIDTVTQIKFNFNNESPVTLESEG